MRLAPSIADARHQVGQARASAALSYTTRSPQPVVPTASVSRLEKKEAKPSCMGELNCGPGMRSL